MTDVLTEATNIISNEDNSVTIMKEEFAVYEQCVKILNALKAHGVDAWEGFEAAMNEAFSE